MADVQMVPMAEYERLVRVLRGAESILADLKRAYPEPIQFTTEATVIDRLRGILEDSVVSEQITMRDLDNRGEDGDPYEFTGTPEQVIGYLDGPLRRDLRDPAAPWLDEAIGLVRAGNLDGANAILGKHAVVFLSRGGSQ